MIRNLLIFLVFLWTGVVTSCSNNDESKSKPDLSDAGPLEDAEVPPIQDGGHDSELPDEDTGPDGGALADAEVGEIIDGGEELDGGGDDAAGPEDTGPPPPPIRQGDLTVFTEAHGVHTPVLAVSMDNGGNIWAAGGGRLHLLPANQDVVRTFDESDGLRSTPVMSVGGGVAGEVIVGYEGLYGPDPFQDAPELRDSGGAARFQLSGDNLQWVEHFQLATASSPSYPDGRYVIRTIYTIVYVHSGTFAGDIWFGGNHGMGMWSARRNRIFEHHHVEINICADGRCTLSTGDHFGVALDAVGDVWMGGAHGIGKLHYGSTGGDFWSSMSPRHLDVWPGQESIFPAGEDHIHAMLVTPNGSIWVGSFGNGLAEVAPDGTVLRRIRAEDGLRENRVTSLAYGPGDVLWVGTAGRGIARLHLGSGHWDYLDSTAGLPSDAVNSLFRLENGSVLVIGTRSGIAILEH